MLQAITWSEFLSFLLIVTIAYYAAVFLVCYRKHLQLLRAFIFRFTTKDHAPVVKKEADPNDVFDQASTLAADLRQIIREASEKEILHTELKFALRSELKNYQQLKNTAFQKAINNLIQKEGNDFCSVSLSEDELNMLWNG